VAIPGEFLVLALPVIAGFYRRSIARFNDRKRDAVEAAALGGQYAPATVLRTTSLGNRLALLLPIYAQIQGLTA
jgi:hypothetical protein